MDEVNDGGNSDPGPDAGPGAAGLPAFTASDNVDVQMVDVGDQTPQQPQARERYENISSYQQGQELDRSYIDGIVKQIDLYQKSIEKLEERVDEINSRILVARNAFGYLGTLDSFLTKENSFLLEVLDPNASIDINRVKLQAYIREEKESLKEEKESLREEKIRLQQERDRLDLLHVANDTRKRRIYERGSIKRMTDTKPPFEHADHVGNVLAPEPLSIASNPTMYLQELNNILSTPFSTTLTESLIQIPEIWTSGTLCQTETMDLSFLDELRLPGKEEIFLPKKIFIRNCMKEIFEVFKKDADDGTRTPGNSHSVLIGSPGVGKSILFFLGALYQAQYSYVVYYRRTTAEGCMSLFIMVPHGTGSVRVWFTRYLLKFGTRGTINDIQSHILGFNSQRNGDLRFNTGYTYVDGPEYKDRENTLDSACDYFCTSGGHPLPKPERQHSFRFLVLSGWTKEEAIAGLNQVYGISKERAVSLYDLCGGEIREMVLAEQVFDKVKQNVDRVLSRLSDRQIAIAVLSTERNDNEKSFDRIRTMFTVDGNPTPIQMIDSTYVLNKLCLMVALEQWFASYTLGVSVGECTLQGLTFERCIHVWFHHVKPSPITSVCWSQGNSEQGIAQLTTTNVYWIPSIPNFPNIDSAVVVGNTLYALQITCQKGKKIFFNDTQFLEEFVSVVKVALATEFQEVVVIYVVPVGSQVTALLHPTIRGSMHYIDTTTLTSFDRSMRSLPFLDHNR